MHIAEWKVQNVCQLYNNISGGAHSHFIRLFSGLLKFKYRIESISTLQQEALVTCTIFSNAFKKKIKCLKSVIAWYEIFFK